MTQNTPNTEIVTIEDVAASDIEKFMASFNDDSSQVVTTLDLSDLDGQDEALAAMTTAEGAHDVLVKLPNAEKDAGIELELTDFIITPSEVLDEESGELRQSMRIILIGSNGEAFSTGSMPVARQLQTIKALRERAGTTLSARPVKIRLVHTLTRNNRTAIALQVVKTAKSAKK